MNICLIGGELFFPHRGCQTGLLAVVLILLTVSCGDSANDAGCKLGDPVAIFSKEMPTVVDHDFNLNGDRGLETVNFDDGLVLELDQSGCESVTQVFQFSVPQREDTQTTRERVVGLFRYLGGKSTDLASFGLYANAFAEILPEEVVRNQPYTLQPGMKVSIDELESGDNRIVRVKIFNEN